MTDLYNLSKLPKLDKNGCFKSGEFTFQLISSKTYPSICVYWDIEEHSLGHCNFYTDENGVHLQDIHFKSLYCSVKTARQYAEAVLELLHIIEQLKA